MTSKSLREKLVDSLCSALEQVGKDPNDAYNFEYSVDRFAILGEQSSPPKVTVTLRGEDGALEQHGFLTRTLGFELTVEVAHNLRASPGLPPETETDRLLDRAVTDIERAILRWVHLDPMDAGLVVQSLSWDRDDGQGGRLETAAGIFLTVGYKHSAIDPRTQVYDPKELV